MHLSNRRRWRTLVIYFFILIFVLCSAYVYYSLKIKQFNYYPNFTENQIISMENTAIDFGPYPSAIIITGTNVISYTNYNDSLPMASTVKLVTALSLIEKIGQDNLNSTVTLTNNDTAITQSYINKGGSVVRFNSGYEISYQTMLEYLLVVSANNFADILVNTQFKSQKEYLNYANNWLEQNNLNSTTVADASGFSSKTISSPRDLTLLGQLALKNQAIKNIVNKKQVALPSGYTKQSTNLFLNTEYGTNIGIKTGNTDEAKYVFLAAAEDNEGPTLISSIMQAPTRQISQQAAIDLINNLGKTYTAQKVFKPQEVILNIDLPWQSNVGVYVKDSINVKNIAKQDITYDIQLQNISNDSHAGQEIGTITVRSTLEQKQFPIYLSNEYNGINAWWRLTHPIN